MAATMDIYTSSSSMDHRISSLLILASCMNACSYFWSYIIGSLHLRESMLPSASLFPSAKCYKSFSNFLWLLSSFCLCFFKVSSVLILILDYFVIASTWFVWCISSFHVYYLTCIMISILILLVFHRYSSSWNILSSKR